MIEQDDVMMTMVIFRRYTCLLVWTSSGGHIPFSIILCCSLKDLSLLVLFTILGWILHKYVYHIIVIITIVSVFCLWHIEYMYIFVYILHINPMSSHTNLLKNVHFLMSGVCSSFYMGKGRKKDDNDWPWDGIREDE